MQVFICLLCGALSVLIQCYIQRPEWALVVILFGIFFRFPVNHIQYRLFYLKTKKRFLRQDNISVNWATVVRIDEDNYRISYMAVNLSKYGYESRYIVRPPMALFVYERTENEFELKMYRVTGGRFRYGDILKKKRMKFTTGEPQFYFVKK